MAVVATTFETDARSNMVPVCRLRRGGVVGEAPEGTQRDQSSLVRDGYRGGRESPGGNRVPQNLVRASQALVLIVVSLRPKVCGMAHGTGQKIRFRVKVECNGSVRVIASPRTG